MASSPSSDPFVTIAIPTFNRSSWLQGCIVASLRQSYANFEIVVSDNASTDATQEVLRGFASEKLRVIRQEENIGLVANWNACLAAAKGSHVVFVSDDDTVAPWLLERCVALARREPEIALIMALSDTYLAGEHRKLPAMLSPNLATGIWRGADVLREFLACRISPVMSSIIFRTDVLRAIGGLPSGWPNAADLACWLPLLVSGKVGFINEPCSTFCVHPEAESSKFTAATRVAELRQLVDVVGNAVDGKIEDARERRDLHLEARRYFARNAIGVIAAQYKRGMPLSATLALLWQWRGDLVHVGLRNVPDLARPIAIILLPRLVTNAVSRALSFVRHVRCMLARAGRGERRQPS
jgi:glycosyltransferase involved in cell wall biosynthesis